MRILYLTAIGTDVFNDDRARILDAARRPDTDVDLISLPADRPQHLEYHAYEAMIVPDIVRHAYAARDTYDAMVISCFYDPALREAREISGNMIVTAPCESATTIAKTLGNTFSIIVGQSKWIPKMRENVRLYGYDHALASLRPIDVGVHDVHGANDTSERLLEVGRKCVEEDGAEALVLGCSAIFGFHETMQQELGVPVIDALQASFKYAEFLADTAQRFGWRPSRRWGNAPPPDEEIARWGLFSGTPPVGARAVAGGSSEPD
ncbi:MAG: aspartate/glutamate racemase family protein [Alphaproteobacteria bacterium]